MTLEQAMAIIEKEGLAEFASFLPRLESDKTYLVRQGADWSVFATNERAAVEGRVTAYPLEREDDALEDFLQRLRDAKWLDDYRRRRARR